jgi:hypothetical protein
LQRISLYGGATRQNGIFIDEMRIGRQRLDCETDRLTAGTPAATVSLAQQTSSAPAVAHRPQCVLAPWSGVGSAHMLNSFVLPWEVFRERVRNTVAPSAVDVIEAR